MSFALVTPYFENVLVGQGWTRWEDPFKIDNIPADILDHSFHIETGDITGEGQNQTILETRVNVVVRLFRKGFQTPNAVKEELITEVQALLCEAMKHGNRLTTAIKNVEFLSATFEPLNFENDNSMLATVNFRTRVLLNIGT